MRARGLLALLVFGSRLASASELGDDGRLRFADDAVLRVGFEDAAALAPSLRTVVLPAGAATWSYQPIAAADLATHLVASDDAIEGRAALHWTAADGLGLTLADATTFASLATQRLVVSFWGRAEGMEPYLAVTYGTDVDLSTSKAWGWARIPAIRTGRETSDGWVEYATGPIDGTVLDRPIHDLLLSARVPTDADSGILVDTVAPHATDAITIDAVEIRPVAGTPATAACTALDVDTTCGPAAECAYGRCVDAAVTWHPVPPLPMQQEIVARVAHWAQHVLGDRTAAARVDAAWVAATLALAQPDATPRTFWGGLNRQIVAIRDSHTHLGAPYGGLSTPFSLRPASNSALDVCFGPTLDDLGDGKLAYVVWRRGTASPAPLQVGDVLTQIDGMEPKAWVDAVYPRYASSLPTVPDADWAPTSRLLASLLAQRAGSIVVSRCSGGTCTPQPAIDVASLALGALASGKYANGTLTCEPRFHDVVDGARKDASGGELFLSKALDATTVGVEFDGFSPTDQTAWKTSVDAAFALPHDKMLIDARQGFGGKNALGDYLFQQLRGTGSPAVLTLAARGTFDDPDAASLFAFDWTTCTAANVPYVCRQADIFVYRPSEASPPGDTAKVAWLDTDDISNNDMVPRLLQGRADLQIFGPLPSYGALGSDVEIPPLMPSWHHGTIAASDARYGTTIADTETMTSCQSGHGVVPDVIVTQKLSDVLAGTDTIVEAAKSWLGP